MEFKFLLDGLFVLADLDCIVDCLVGHVELREVFFLSISKINFKYLWSQI